MVALSAVLPLLLKSEIMTGWYYIVRRINDDPKAVKFKKYMVKQWLQDECMSMWCAYGEQHRTTNALEAWHSKLNRAVSKKKPNLMHSLEILKGDAAFYTSCVFRYRNKTEPLHSKCLNRACNG
jgi:hypothetical protein